MLCDEEGRWESIGNVHILRSASGVLVSILLDVKTLIFWWCYLQIWLMRAKRTPADIEGGNPEVAYLIPTPANMGSGGGAISHIRGFLYGLKAAGITCRVFSGTALAQDAFENEIIAARSRPSVSYTHLVINPEEKTNVFSARLLHLDNDLTAAEVDRASKEAAYNAVKSGSLPAAEASDQGEQLRALEEKLNLSLIHISQAWSCSAR